MQVHGTTQDRLRCTTRRTRWKGLSVRTTGTVEGARLLLEHGANIHSKDNEDRTALQLALANGRDEIARLLSEHGATG